MSKQFKYIIVKKLGHELPILFHTIFDHTEIAQDLPVISAGFCQIFNDCEKVIIGVCTYGKSTTLKKESRPEDKDIILRNIEQ